MDHMLVTLEYFFFFLVSRKKMVITLIWSYTDACEPSQLLVRLKMNEKIKRIF